MAFNDILKKLFGNKAARDLKEIEPYVEKIKAAYETIKTLSNDELRERTESLKRRVQEFVAPEVNRIAELRASIEGTEINLREKIYTEIDKLEKEITEKLRKSIGRNFCPMLFLL
jgi:preprotein translocase subunit SecA